METNGNVEEASVEIASKASVGKETSKLKDKSQQSKASHPSTSEMVNTAIKELKDRKGSSLQAIKKYITSTYKVDVEKVTPFIKRYLKSAVTSGEVVQTTGKGASGSFKLSSSSPKNTKPKTMKVKKASKKSESDTIEKKPTEKKAAAGQKKEKDATEPKKKEKIVKKPSAAGKKKGAVTAEETSDGKDTELPEQKTPQKKSPSKMKKAKKAPAAKMKAPKPKTTKSPKSAKASTKK